MNLVFDAAKVECSDAMDGELRRVTFDASVHDDETNRKDPYFSIGRNFEFPGGPSIEWHDGKNYAGGSVITSMDLDRQKIDFRTNRSDSFLIKFTLSDSEFNELKRNLEIIMRKDTFDEEI